MGVSLQLMMDLFVAGFSLMIGLGLFAFIASILCSAAFLQNAKELSWFVLSWMDGCMYVISLPILFLDYIDEFFCFL